MTIEEKTNNGWQVIEIIEPDEDESATDIAVAILLDMEAQFVSPGGVFSTPTLIEEEGEYEREFRLMGFGETEEEEISQRVLLA